jgi:hypothetical protein
VEKDTKDELRNLIRFNLFLKFVAAISVLYM